MSAQRALEPVQRASYMV